MSIATIASGQGVCDPSKERFGCRVKNSIDDVGESSSQAGNREVEKCAQFQRQPSLTCIDQTRWPWRGFKLAEHDIELSGRLSESNLIREHARDSCAGNGRCNGSFSRIDDKA